MDICTEWFLNVQELLGTAIRHVDTAHVCDKALRLLVLRSTTKEIIRNATEGGGNKESLLSGITPGVDTCYAAAPYGCRLTMLHRQGEDINRQSFNMFS